MFSVDQLLGVTRVAGEAVVLFPLIILEMFLQLNWSPPVVNSIDWT